MRRVYRFKSRWARAAWLVCWASLLTSIGRGEGAASTISAEYRLFGSICLLIETDPSAVPIQELDRNAIYSQVSNHIKERLQTQKADYPVQIGRSCFRNTITQPNQLSLWLHLTIARAPEPANLIVASIILHTYYGSEQKSPHDFPTAIAFCRAAEPLAPCLAKGITSYLDETLFPAIDKAKRAIGETR
jgi:hypothetical protein